MKFTLFWLKDHLETSASLDEILYALTDLGLEVEGVVNPVAKLAPFSRLNLPIGGGYRSINAAKVDHGPSWRMVISLTAETEAYGVYPGGQSGNPGSKYYDSFVDQWAAGKYYSLWMMTKAQTGDKRILAKMSFNK